MLICQRSRNQILSSRMPKRCRQCSSNSSRSMLQQGPKRLKPKILKKRGERRSREKNGKTAVTLSSELHEMGVVGWHGNPRSVGRWHRREHSTGDNAGLGEFPDTSPSPAARNNITIKPGTELVKYCHLLKGSIP